MSTKITFKINHWTKASHYGASSPAWSRYYVEGNDGTRYGFFYVKRKWDDDKRLRFEYPESIEMNGDESILTKVAEAMKALRADYVGSGPAEEWEEFRVMMGLSYASSKPCDKNAKDRQKRFSTIEA